MGDNFLTYYSRKEVQDAIVDSSRGREVAVRLGDKGFGKRPDTLTYPRDVYELAKAGATSFHISEELWENPRKLDVKLTREEINNLRIGWDLVIDVDFEEWNATKLITHSLVRALKAHKVSSVTCKFSGNKGFHIGVPFEAFPDKVIVKGQMIETRRLFPEGVQRILKYLTDYIDNKNNGFEVSRKILGTDSFKEFLVKNGKNADEVTIEICNKCGTEYKEKIKEEMIEFICPKCEFRVLQKEDRPFLRCSKCSTMMEKMKIGKVKRCSKCKGTNFVRKLNLKIDAILISSRHLFRGTYSLHEKSGLVSIPIDADNVLEFGKESAHPEKAEIGKYPFLNREKASGNEGKELIIRAFDFKPDIEEEKIETNEQKEFEEIGEAIPRQFFPPCIENVLKGVEDGKKRSLFILVNYLTSIGWAYDDIEKLLNEWNKKNSSPFREGSIENQIRYHKGLKKKILPPNCANDQYYKDFGVCKPDNFCAKIRNPAQYSIRKAKIAQEAKPKKRGKKEEAINSKDTVDERKKSDKPQSL